MTTILYANNGTNDFMLMNGSSLYFLTYTYEQNDLGFLIQDTPTRFESILTLKSDLLKKEKTSLVIEVEPGTGGHSSESLRHLIRFRGDQIVLREPNEEERKRLEEYQQKQTSMQFFRRVLWVL